VPVAKRKQVLAEGMGDCTSFSQKDPEKGRFFCFVELETACRVSESCELKPRQLLMVFKWLYRLFC